MNHYDSFSIESYASKGFVIRTRARVLYYSLWWCSNSHRLQLWPSVSNIPHWTSCLATLQSNVYVALLKHLHSNMIWTPLRSRLLGAWISIACGTESVCVRMRYTIIAFVLIQVKWTKYYGLVIIFLKVHRKTCSKETKKKTNALLDVWGPQQSS